MTGRYASLETILIRGLSRLLEKERGLRSRRDLPAHFVFPIWQHETGIELLEIPIAPPAPPRRARDGMTDWRVAVADCAIRLSKKGQSGLALILNVPYCIAFSFAAPARRCAAS